MPEQIRIRPAEQADFDAWLPLWDGYNAFYGRSATTALPLAITRTTWSRFHDVDEPMHALVAEGATIITQKNNEEFFDRALNTPRTLLNDTLAKSPKKAKVEAVGEKKVYSDGTRTVEMYHIYPAPHSNGLMVAYIPKEKILFQGDFSLPAPGQPGNDHVKALVPALEKLKVTDFDRYINVHTSAEPQTKAELWKAAGK